MSNNEPQKVKPSRASIRSGIFSRNKPKSEIIEFFGQDVEVRQPTMRALLGMQTEEGSTARKSAMMIIDYTFVPGTNEKVFEPADADSLEGMPFGADMKRMNDVIQRLTGLSEAKVEETAKNSAGTSTA